LTADSRVAEGLCGTKFPTETLGLTKAATTCPGAA
jgi:hypothetical protein